MDRHTPGPWEPVARQVGASFAVIEVTAAGRPDPLAFVPTDLKRPAYRSAAEADARLIAAAPRLLAEARRLLLYLASLDLAGTPPALALAEAVTGATEPAKENPCDRK